MRTSYPPDLLYSIATDFDGAPRMFRDMAVCTSERLAHSPAAPQGSKQHPVLRALRLRAGAAAAAAAGAATGRGVTGGTSSTGSRGGGNHTNEHLVHLMRGIFGDGATCSSSSSNSTSASSGNGECDSSEGEGKVTMYKVRQSVRWRYLFLSGTLNSVVVATRDDANRCITFQL